MHLIVCYLVAGALRLDAFLLHMPRSSIWARPNREFGNCRFMRGAADGKQVAEPSSRVSGSRFGEELKETA